MIDLPYRPNWVHDAVTGRTSNEDIEIMKLRAEKNRNLPIGTVVYYIKKHGNQEWNISFGTIKDFYPPCAVLTLYSEYERRMVMEFLTMRLNPSLIFIRSCQKVGRTTLNYLN